jgi:prepilin-type N-terminal cleavage/methylation domain-containing protein
MIVLLETRYLFRLIKDNAMKRKQGFTLIELLVVISIISLLMAILVPALNKAKEVAKRTICGHNLKQIGIAVVAYSADADFLPFYGGWDRAWSSPFNVPLDRPTTRDELHPYAAFRLNSPWGNDTVGPPDLVPMKMGCLYVQRYIGDAKLFYCPSNRDLNYRYESYTKPYPPNTSSGWGSLPQAYNANSIPAKNQWVRVGYAYYPIDETLQGSSGMIPIGGTPVPKYTARRFTVLSRKMPYATDGLWKRKDLSHKSGINSDGIVKNAGVNALFKDGHVRFVKDSTVLDELSGTSPMLFNNEYWDHWDPLEGDMDAGLDARYIFYNIFRMIDP